MKTSLETVEENLKIFDNEIPKEYLDLILREKGGSRHALFYSLYYPQVFSRLKEAVETIKAYNKEKYFPKILSKLLSNHEWWGQQLVIFEIILASFYFKKFKSKKPVLAEWERKFLSGEKATGISILSEEQTIRIEIIRENGFSGHKGFQLLNKLRQALEAKPRDFPDAKHLYIISLEEKGSSNAFTNRLSEKNMKEAERFIVSLSEKKEGCYFFGDSQKPLMKIEKKGVRQLDNYPSQFDIVSGFLDKEELLKKIITETSCESLSFEEINFVFMPDFGGNGDKTWQEAFIGEKDIHENGVKPILRKPTGAVNIIDLKGCPPVHGLIYSGFNYGQKKIITNPLSEPADKFLNLVA